ncbi:MAG: hypothetical protein DWQ44_10480 [Bacteroidetes bacterium]|nr:MAG: hypothetical protein DWQ33_06605 [Bacteroidota bacterium]REK00059.1 MAG: hypothetical protein DWQ39_12485 [Bacteroidota bacterium]REK32937.1 MAG: hypothetical protein DWQ44_10480 [Bacteroidota bacterium]REK47738.1 MAG: hypothetical protein DWQ48_12220 [Bacteroidota bacterium]
MTTYQYKTVSEALNELYKQGYTIDFNLEDNGRKFEEGVYRYENFWISKVFRYEGQSDPGDESVVYAIESKDGVKGVLVSGFGMSNNRSATKILQNLKVDAEKQ